MALKTTSEKGRVGVLGGPEPHLDWAISSHAAWEEVRGRGLYRTKGSCESFLKALSKI